jgi:hypothetical protein
VTKFVLDNRAQDYTRVTLGLNQFSQLLTGYPLVPHYPQHFFQVFVPFIGNSGCLHRDTCNIYFTPGPEVKSGVILGVSVSNTGVGVTLVIVKPAVSLSVSYFVLDKL